MEPKVLISLISVALGWLLAQGTTLAREWWNARKLRIGLVTELEDINAQLDRVLLIHRRHLQVFALKGMEPSSSLPLQNMFFRQYYKDAFSHLNREQRISYQLIHAQLEHLNTLTNYLTDHYSEFFKQNTTEPDEKKTLVAIELWGEYVTAIYKTAKALKWHIDYHLTNRDKPTFDLMGPMHESYVKFEQNTDDEVKAVITGAKGLKREAFDKIYDPTQFAGPKNAG